ncbi:MAG: L-ribulokinase [Clostridium sp.]|jgi:L-ribulokinase
MSAKKYSIGLDFGTQSGRAVLVEVATGNEVSTCVMEYKDGVIDKYLPGTNIKLKADWALQNPDNYIEVLIYTIRKVMEESGVSPENIIGLGVDFTACTMAPINKEGKVLCQEEKFKNNPHAWVKLWKHHAAQPEATKLVEIANSRKEKFIDLYAGTVSSEWLMPKIWQILNEAPEIYEAAHSFIEIADWITLQLTGEEKRNSCTAGYKDFWHKQNGFPSKEFFKALDPRLENLVEEKLSSNIYPIGSKAGELTEEFAKKTGLKAGISVAVGNIDAHVAVPALNVVEADKMVMIMGTSTCHMVLSKEEKIIKGVSGVVEDGIVPGFYGYEAGQSAVGDIFEWYIDNCVPESYKNEALEKKVNIHNLLEEKASKLKPGENGLLALDWWNGSRSVLMDADLTGLIIGLTLQTKPEEIYRALIEATAFGTNRIIEAFKVGGIQIKELYACGGLSLKNKMLMQIYSDVTGMEIKIGESVQTPAVGAAMFGALAAGKANGGYDSIYEASDNMAKLKHGVYKPISENVVTYKVLYEEYKKLHDYFGCGENNVMKKLKELKRGI